MELQPTHPCYYEVQYNHVSGQGTGMLRDMALTGAVVRRDECAPRVVDDDPKSCRSTCTLVYRAVLIIVVTVPVAPVGILVRVVVVCWRLMAVICMRAGSLTATYEYCNHVRVLYSYLYKNIAAAPTWSCITADC